MVSAKLVHSSTGDSYPRYQEHEQEQLILVCVFSTPAYAVSVQEYPFRSERALSHACGKTCTCEVPAHGLSEPDEALH
jgi:hypothetical protein